MIKKKCAKPTCKTSIPARQRTPYCEEHTPEGYGQGYKQRNEKTRAFYKSPPWRRLRKSVIAEHHGLCAECFKYGDIIQADVVHHIKEITTVEGWQERLTRSNLIPLCHACHAAQHPEKGGSRVE